MVINQTIAEFTQHHSSPGNHGPATGVFFKRIIPTDPSVVYRVDFSSPETIKEQGGFIPRQMDLQIAEFSIYAHSHSSLAGKNSPYVSTSIRPQGAEIFASPGHVAYLYEIHATPNFIDTFTTLGGSTIADNGEPYLLHRAEREFLALGGIKWDQIISWTALPNGRDTLKSDRKLQLNKDYNPIYDKLKASGPQYQLAIFPAQHEAWTKDPWSQYRNMDIKEIGLQFADNNGKSVGLARDNPLKFELKHSVGKSTFYIPIPEKSDVRPPSNPQDKGDNLGLDGVKTPVVDTKTYLEKTSPERIKLAEMAEDISEKEFSELTTKYQRNLDGKLSKSLLNVRQKLNYKPIPPTSKVWGEFGKVQKSLAIAGIAFWVNVVIQAFTHNTTELERAAAVTAIVPFVGCGLDLVSRIMKNKANAVDTSLCVFADMLLSSPFFPLGVIVHIARAVMTSFTLPDMPSQEEFQKERNTSWNNFLYHEYYIYLYSHLSLYPDNSGLRYKIGAALTIEALDVLSQGAQAIGIVQAITQHNLTSESPESRKQGVSTIQELRDNIYPQMIRRQRQYVINIPKIIKNDSDTRISAIVDQFNRELRANITSRNTAEKYIKVNPVSWRLPTPPRSNEAQVYSKLNLIANHLLQHPLALPGIFDIAFTIGQSLHQAALNPDLLSPMKFMQEKVQDEYTINKLCLYHARQVEQLLLGKITENQLLNRSSVLDAENIRDLQILLALKLGRVFDDDKYQKLEILKSAYGGEWRYDVEYQKSAELRELVTYPYVPSIHSRKTEGYIMSVLEFSDDVIAQACLG
ncbi:hypothetical protein QQS21_004882 [Conoideocrella luteorostrata]|uniref:Uncharacterized protein n=1 Tax=Conoideocrella luteorostrata TaxID=1105319 RepID=A0AAJ0CRI5_9HYPO|nr:hypothetical protein QQS21_004882 [Conoideocrella luteorostrata]